MLNLILRTCIMHALHAWPLYMFAMISIDALNLSEHLTITGLEIQACNSQQVLEPDFFCNNNGSRFFVLFQCFGQPSDPAFLFLFSNLFLFPLCCNPLKTSQMNQSNEMDVVAVVNCLKTVFGHGCSTAVEYAPHNQELVVSNPAGCWFFSSSIFSYFPSPVECPKSGHSRRFISNCLLWKQWKIDS